MKHDYLQTLQTFFSDLIRQHGYPLHINTQYCKTYRVKHPNCEKCESEEGCRRYSQLMGLAAQNIIDPHKEKNNEHFLSEIHKILNDDNTSSDS